MAGLRIVVAEDAALFREGLVRLLSDAGHEVIAAVGDADALLAAADAHVPDVAVVDVRMPPDHDSDGARAAGILRLRHPGMGIMLLSQHIELRSCLELIGTPRFGYLLKESVLRIEDFDDALRRVADGGVALDPAVVQALVRAQAVPAGLSVLTDREREVLGMVAEGRSNLSIAERLTLSDRTVEAHMRSIFTKLGLHDDGTSHRRVLAVLAYMESPTLE